MDKKNYLFALTIALLGSMTLAGCSSSEVSDAENGVTADELPVVDAETDQLPNQLDQATSDGTLAEATPTTDSLAPEAPVDVPTSTDGQQVAEAPANSPSFDAPPSMNETAPVATAAETHDTAVGGSELYEVQGGDTLMKIAFKVYGDVYQWRKVLDANGDRISDPARLVKGTQLRVDNAASESYYDGYERYLIKSGDTLGVISDDVYGTRQKWKHLWRMNDGLVKDPNRIYAGFFLRYTMTEEEKQESDRLRATQPAPLADSSEEAVRNPSSAQKN